MKAADVTAESFRGEIRTMWCGGPDRRWSAVSIPGARLHMADGSYGGSYVCQACRSVTVGVYVAKTAKNTQESGFVGSVGLQKLTATQNREPRKHRRTTAHHSTHL